jgi:hypothetical protein
MDMDEASRAYHEARSKQELGEFRVSTISRVLEEVPEAIRNRIQRERRKALGEPLFLYLEMAVMVCRDTWGAIRFLGKNKLEHGRQVEFLYAVPPLTRTILDTLLTVIFMFDDPEKNVRKYYAGDWRDRYEDYKQLEAGHRSDPAWTERLNVDKADIEQIGKLAGGITQAEQDDIDRILAGLKDKKTALIRYWPNPGSFGKSVQIKDPKREAFCRHLNTWHYGILSSDSHLNFTGLERRGGTYAQPADGFDLERHHDDSRSTFMFEAMTVYVALLSEIACQLGFAHEKGRLREAWGHLNAGDPAGLYKERYEDWLR